MFYGVIEHWAFDMVAVFATKDDLDWWLRFGDFTDVTSW